MEFLRQKCAGPPKSEPEQKLAEVSLEQFAALGGLTGSQYYQKIFELLETGRLFELLTIEGRIDLMKWMNELLAQGESDFGVVFVLSLNRERDICLWCSCSFKLSNGPTGFYLYVKHAIPGFIDTEIPEMEGLEYFELGFTDMEPRI